MGKVNVRRGPIGVEVHIPDERNWVSLPFTESAHPARRRFAENVDNESGHVRPLVNDHGSFRCAKAKVSQEAFAYLAKPIRGHVPCPPTRTACHSPNTASIGIM